MNILLLYLVLLKATATSFAGLASLPVVRDELVVKRQVLTDTQLNEAVVMTRATPGPVGLYVVSVGYFVAGIAGAIAGWAAMITPAFMILPLVKLAGRSAQHPRLKSALQGTVLASAGLLLAASIPLIRAAITDPLTLLISAATIALLACTKLDTLWIILGAAGLASSVSAMRLVAGL